MPAGQAMAGQAGQHGRPGRRRSRTTSSCRRLPARTLHPAAWCWRLDPAAVLLGGAAGCSRPCQPVRRRGQPLRPHVDAAIRHLAGWAGDLNRPLRHAVPVRPDEYDGGDALRRSRRRMRPRSSCQPVIMLLLTTAPVCAPQSAGDPRRLAWQLLLGARHGAQRRATPPAVRDGPRADAPALDGGGEMDAGVVALSRRVTTTCCASGPRHERRWRDQFRWPTTGARTRRSTPTCRATASPAARP